MDARSEQVPVELRSGRLRERIYATISMVAVVVGVSATGSESVRGAVVTILTTAFGLWAAMMVAEIQVHRIQHGMSASWRDLRRMLYVSAPVTR